MLKFFKRTRSPLSGERGGSVVECRTPEREVRGSRPTVAVLCPWARHFTPRKYWLITQEAMAPSRHDWKIVDWDVKPQHNQPTNSTEPSMLIQINAQNTYLIYSVCRLLLNVLNTLFIKKAVVNLATGALVIYNKQLKLSNSHGFAVGALVTYNKQLKLSNSHGFAVGALVTYNKQLKFSNSHGFAVGALTDRLMDSNVIFIYICFVKSQGVVQKWKKQC